ncbi:MAG: hypothetical protein CMO01_04065 [Thalassobius sp.]|nr:hypothetical protein [Thalassovita sp.]|tara:strand:- start:123494 stop:125275 length:1782 start_codon:yes stop_codon:yes gene_type:complete
MSKLPKGVKGYECKHAFYTEASDRSGDDLILVKRNVHKEDGTVIPEVNFVENYEREFWVVNEAHRTYEEKKAWEDMFKCRRYKCRQTELTNRVLRALGRNPSGWTQQSIAFRSPYVYGADISTSALIKRAYMDNFPELTRESTVGVMDIETDVVNGDGSTIISASFTYQNNIYIAYTEDFAGKLSDYAKKLQDKYEYYIGGIADDLDALLAGDTLNGKRRQVLERAAATLRERSKVQINSKLVASPALVTDYVFRAAHEHKPDFVAFWNMNFDLPKMIASLENANIDPKDVFCEPTLPERYKKFKYVPGKAIKQIAGGRTMSKHPADLWHKVYAPSSFYLIDAMCVFKQVRVTEGNRNSYSLDAILTDELNLGKLKFKEADHLTGLDWHVYMQTNHKIEYLIYNIFDCMSIEILDDKNKDLALTVPTLCQHSDYYNFTSTPRRLCDDMHFYLKKHKKVISTTSDDMAESLDKHVVGSNDWIVTLPSHLVDDNGLQLLEEAPHIRSMLRVHVADLDVASSYPNTGSFMNMSMETTVRELVGVGDISEYDKRMSGLNLTAARTNAVECSGTFFGFPSMDKVLTEFRRQREAGELD